MKNNTEGLSIIIPAYNEASAIEDVLLALRARLLKADIKSEIIVVDDGSTDDTKKILARIENIRVVSHQHNRGYGAALKTGAINSQYDWIVFYDADGQHTPENIFLLLAHSEGADMVVGARIAYRGPWIRRPGKWLLTRVANYLVDMRIPDLNSGMRLVKKDEFAKYAHLYPNGFSLSTTITLAFLKSGLSVNYVPIDIEERVGTSTVSIKDAPKTLALIFRMITLFSPLRVFFPLTILFGLCVVVSLGYDIVNKNLADTTVLLFLATLIMFSFGVTLDHVAAIRRELHRI